MNVVLRVWYELGGLFEAGHGILNVLHELQSYSSLLVGGEDVVIDCPGVDKRSEGAVLGDETEEIWLSRCNIDHFDAHDDGGGVTPLVKIDGSSQPCDLENVIWSGCVCAAGRGGGYVGVTLGHFALVA
jgi:hypothetical protein